MFPASKLKITASEYLEGERTAENKHEFIDGEVYAMAGASENHNTISLNLASELNYKLKNSPCKPFMADMQIGVLGDYFYPDIVVVCEPHQDDTTYIKHAPMLIVEVLSKNTRAFDHSAKQIKYLQIPSVEYYVLIEQDYCEVSVLSRAAGFVPKYYYLGDTVDFPLLEVAVTVNDIYDRVENEDKVLYLQRLVGE